MRPQDASNLHKVALGDKYRAGEPLAYMTGNQALVRLLLEQAASDRAAGHRTAGYVSGYRGSPLGGLDQALWRAKAELDAADIRFQPGLNEDLAATAVWGTQLVHQEPSARVEGVFALWYGKGPGLDRSMDALKHGGYAGSSPKGGVLAVVGDDPGAFSSTTAHQSEFGFQAAAIPVLAPADPQDMLDLGLAGWAMSRATGAWAGLKLVSELVETSAILRPPRHFDVDASDAPSLRWPEPPLATEEKALGVRLDRVRDFVRARALDRTIVDPQDARLLIVTVGKAHHDLMDALRLLGVDAAEAGLRVRKLAMSWPIEPHGLREAARGVCEIVVVEEKRAFVEPQLARLMLDWPERIALAGKAAGGDALLPETGMLSPSLVAAALARRLAAHDLLSPRAEARAEALSPRTTPAPAPTLRAPFFCAGCPHNRSTRVPEGSQAMAGIGCHGMASWMGDREIVSMSHMGGEGLQWVGLSPFVGEAHRFQNMGDGTYAHSGSLCLRAAAEAKTNVTFKILVNDAVAMTGGQPVEGGLGVTEIAQAAAADGAKRVAIVSDAPEAIARARLPRGVTVHHRDELDAVQRTLCETPGVTALLYVQTCAAEKRRRRKRGKLETPARKVHIDPLVCEGCGDCSVKSNCIAVEPLETPLGRKRRINQSACNRDYSCLDGFCPSFATVEGEAAPGTTRLDPATLIPDDLPVPATPALSNEPYNVLLTGIGGTGVVTVSALMGMAAHLDGLAVSVLDVAGLAQKNGAVGAHIRIAREPDMLAAARIPAGQTDLLLAADLVVAASAPLRAALSPQRTRAVLNADIAPTAGYVTDRDFDFQERRTRGLVAEATRTQAELAAVRHAESIFGDAVMANVTMLGFAWQRGLVPLSYAALEEAIRLNGTAVETNLQAFALGHLLAERPDALAEAPSSPQPAGPHARHGAVPDDLDTLVADRAAFLADYQDAAWAARYEATLTRVRETERARLGREGPLSRAVAVSLFKLMSYKDEYEVARLWLRSPLRQAASGARLRVHLAPPLLARSDATGAPRKTAFGPWVFAAFRVLAPMKALRGRALDPFGHTAERRRERAMIAAYETEIDAMLARLAPDTLDRLVAIAALPQDVRGFGHVKAAAEARVARTRETLWRALDEASAALPDAAE